MLFSEPKIPQYTPAIKPVRIHARFSALQRAENSSIVLVDQRGVRGRGFSALQRAENSSIMTVEPRIFETEGFSALQRAENSSIRRFRYGHQSDT